MGICSPPGWNKVTPPSMRVPSAFSGSIRFFTRTLAKVPRIITSWLPRRVAVEVGLGHAVVHQVLPRGRLLLDGSGGRDVVGGERIAEDAERARGVHVVGLAGVHAEALEEGRLGDVSGLS